MLLPIVCLVGIRYHLALLTNKVSGQCYKHFNPRHQLPTRKHFTKVEVPALVSEVKEGIQEKIHD